MGNWRISSNRFSLIFASQLMRSMKYSLHHTLTFSMSFRRMLLSLYHTSLRPWWLGPYITPQILWLSARGWMSLAFSVHHLSFFQAQRAFLFLLTRFCMTQSSSSKQSWCFLVMLPMVSSQLKMMAIFNSFSFFYSITMNGPEVLPSSTWILKLLSVKLLSGLFLWL